ncbi:MAG: hypothetical protein HFH37_09835 [Lachnospiraceae bacterium]|nr:hypothetical protein [Lachnospiraceae bacterium]
MAERIITIVIIAISAAPMIILGIVQYNSKEPVGFWSGKEPPKSQQVTDVKAYNRRHGVMWIVYGLGFFPGFAPVIIWGEEFALIAVALFLIECIGGIFVMIAYHNKLNRRYLKE